MIWMAPRGIVAAAISSIFAFELEELGYPEASALAAIILLVIVGTVIFYGLTAGPLARRLGLAEQDPQGLLIVGAHPISRAFAAELNKHDVRTLLLDNNFGNITQSRLEGLEAHYGNALSEETLQELDLSGIGRMLALTGNDDINALAVLHFPDVFGRANVYQLPTARDGHAAPAHLRGRSLFSSNATYGHMEELMNAGATVKSTALSPSFAYADYLAHYGERSPIALAVVTGDSKLQLFTDNNSLVPKPGQTIISLVSSEDVDGQG